MVFSHNCDGETFTCKHLLEYFLGACKSPKPPAFCEFASVVQALERGLISGILWCIIPVIFLVYCQYYIFNGFVSRVSHPKGVSTLDWPTPAWLTLDSQSRTTRCSCNDNNSQGIWQGAAKFGKLCGIFKSNCAAQKANCAAKMVDYAANCAIFQSNFNPFPAGFRRKKHFFAVYQ